MERLIFHGDCLEIMQDIPDQSIDLILCDLPYGTTACKWDIIIPFDKLWQQYKRIIKLNGAIVLFGSEPFSSHLRLSNIKYYKYDWFWYKNAPTGISLSKTQPMRCLESISVFCYGKTIYNKQKVRSKIKDRTLGKKNGKFYAKAKGENVAGFDAFVKKENPENILLEMVNPRNVLEFNVVPRALGTLHPTQKPVELLAYLIKTYTQEGDVVLDNTMGSGSTGVAAIQTGRSFIGIEKDETYFKIAEERINKAYGEVNSNKNDSAT